MKILFFSPYFHPYVSGLTTYPLKLLSHLAKSHSVTVLTFRHHPSLLPREKIHNLQIIRLPYDFRISKGFISTSSLSVYLTQIKTHDLLILNLPNVEGLPLAYLAKHYHRPIISIYHCQIDLGTGLSAKVITTVLNKSINFQLASSTYITAYTQDYVTHHPQINKYQSKVIIVPPPVSQLPTDQDFLSHLIKQKQGQVWLGYSGRTAREKGLEYLITAATALAPSFPLKLVFAGPYGSQVAGEMPYYQQLLSQLQQSGLNYQFLGTLSAGKLGAFYKAINVLCLPSVNSTEAFGMVQAEAMLLGTPVVAANLPGLRVPLKQTGMGKIVEPGDPLSLQQALEEIITHHHQYHSPSQIHSAKVLFNEAKTYKLYDQLIQNLSG